MVAIVMSTVRVREKRQITIPSDPDESVRLLREDRDAWTH